MKNALYLIGFLLGGFVIYKLIQRLGGSSGSGTASPASISPNTAARFENITNTPKASGNRVVQAQADNTVGIISASFGALKSLVGLGSDISKAFSKPATTSLASGPISDFGTPAWSGTKSEPFTWSFNGSTPAVDYSLPSYSEPSFDWNSTGQTAWA